MSEDNPQRHDHPPAIVIEKESTRTRVEILILLGLLVASVIAFRIGFSATQVIFQLVLPVFFLTHVVDSAVRWLHRRDRRGRAFRGLRTLVDDYGGGFYGVSALLTFLHLESQTLRRQWTTADSEIDFLSKVSFESVLGLGVDSMWNAVHAGIWPVYWLGELGLSAVWLVLVAWLAYRAGLVMTRPWLPPRAIEKPSDRDDQGGAYRNLP